MSVFQISGIPSVLGPAGRRSMPAPGRSLSATTEASGVLVRAAVRQLEDSLEAQDVSGELESLLGPLHRFGNLTFERSDIGRRAAWALVNMHFAARAAGAIDAFAGFCDAEDWFVGANRTGIRSVARLIPTEAAEAAHRALAQISFDSQFQDLLPYVLQPNGPGSRLSILRNPATRLARDAKRRAGEFYTPTDVAEYMVHRSVSAHSKDHFDLRCLDPSCGTGVFLIAQLRAAMAGGNRPSSPLEYASRCLYGVDVNPLAIETCAFVLLHECLSDLTRRGISAWAAWHLLRLNLGNFDALKLVPGGDAALSAELRSRREAVLNTLLSGTAPKSTVGDDRIARASQSSKDWFSFGDAVPAMHVFPEVEGGFDLVVGNPPYAGLGPRTDWFDLKREYESLQRVKPSPTVNSYPMFIEMMWRLTRPGHSVASLVVPLSIAYHQGTQFEDCRRAISQHGGTWQCAFFDREPHALFGEDVKTRNAILFRRETSGDPPRGEAATFQTSPLLKWTSRTRSRLFASIQFTSLGRVSIARGLPKIGGEEQANAFRQMISRPIRLKSLAASVGGCSLKEVRSLQDGTCVFVGSTAYNFVNVFLSLPHMFGSDSLVSENGLTYLRFNDVALAHEAFAILSSRLVYWFWRVRGDGFHIPRSFIESLPFGRGSFDHDQVRVLAESGRSLWETIENTPLVSVNRGRRSVAFRPFSCERERDVIDTILIDAAGIDERFASELRNFVRETVVVDRSDARRNHLNEHFQVRRDR